MDTTPTINFECCAASFEDVKWAADALLYAGDRKAIGPNLFGGFQLRHDLPTKEELSRFPFKLRCANCDDPILLSVGDEVGKELAVVIAECDKCAKRFIIPFTTHRDPSGGLLVFSTSSTDPAVASTVGSTRCRCGMTLSEPTISAEHTLRRLTPFMHQCGRCSCGFAILIIDSPITYFNHCLKMAGPLQEAFPAQALVFVVAALENFLQKAFLFSAGGWGGSDDFNLFLVRKRKVSFQNLQEAKDIYRHYFRVDIGSLAGPDWNLLLTAGRTRNDVVHNAAHVTHYRPVVVTPQYVTESRCAVEKLVSALDSLLRARRVY